MFNTSCLQEREAFTYTRHTRDLKIVVSRIKIVWSSFFYSKGKVMDRMQEIDNQRKWVSSAIEYI